ncbi:quinone oxidoreductase family protein [Amycolatopsis viridis]|uniref:NADPH:quinone reductase-like Zn-dependent oxidoreductase n=1 Tax=Amycolatopsis viridis TaxID=185678 RepID=A0ABX0SPL2_9PSEU|nr:zinc-binding dehydrogenase [Amycolatopsis viridis]NIH78897.1 NADPH:quinone reductase-like Zn-dependent oxidoreductase [Amycolatopsis viridis]
MRAVRFHEFGGPEHLRVEQLPDPHPDGEHVLIRVTRAGVSPLDDKVRAGVLPPSMRKPLPLVPGASAVGRVTDPGGSGYAPGTRVLLCGWGYGTKTDGTWREVLAVPPTHLVAIPDGVTDDEAAALVAGSGYLTAWLALTSVVPLRPGQVVLAPGIHGAVASAAAQVAPILGAAQVISTARGADRVAAVPHDDQLTIIDLGRETLAEGVARVTGGSGVDIVLDPLGGDITGQALGTLRAGGTLVSIGYTAGTKATIDVTDLIWKTAKITGFLFTAFTQQDIADTYRTLLQQLGTGALKPAVDRIYPLEQAADAQRRVVEDRPPGRVFLDPTSTDHQNRPDTKGATT